LASSADAVVSDQSHESGSGVATDYDLRGWYKSVLGQFLERPWRS